MQRLKLLLIEDNPGDARLIQDMVAEAPNADFSLAWEQTLKSGLESLERERPDAVLLDLGLPDSPQRSVSFTRVQSAVPNVPIIVLTGLDDETFAVTTVRRGAQDYLVKGRIDAATLVRTIRYAIARKLGGDKPFTAAELGRCDGREGRPACFAFKGKVYDATSSRLWKNGKHGAVHVAGTDLTESLAKAPHNEDVFSRLPILGVLVVEETLGRRWLRRIDRLHPHATLVHLSVAYTAAAPFFFFAWILSGRPVFDQIAAFLLGLGLATTPLSFLTGVISWIVNYETKAARAFNLKFALGVALFLMLLGTYLWWRVGPEIILSRPECYFYLAALVIQAGLAFAADFYGKKIVYS
ncbi:MAG TPA: response regulator [Acidobacteriota bacterium]|nr:response regulator [Acidobacteriota bacterium]